MTAVISPGTYPRARTAAGTCGRNTLTSIVAATTPGTAGWLQRIPTITATVAAPDTAQFRVRKSDHARWGKTPHRPSSGPRAAETVPPERSATPPRCAGASRQARVGPDAPSRLGFESTADRAGGVLEPVGALGIDAAHSVEPTGDDVEGEADVADIADVAVILGMVGPG